jgi:hypothetical protein
VTCQIDPDSLIEEENRDNNILQKNLLMDRFNVSQELGTVSGAGQSDTVGIHQKVFCYIPPGSIPTSSVIQMEILTGMDERASKFGISANEEVIQLSLPVLSDKQELNHKATLIFYPKNQDTLLTMKPFQWDGSINRWIFCPSIVTDSTFHTEKSSLGYFRLMDNKDQNPPVIEIQVDNQPFIPGSFVPRQPLMSAIIQDESGVDIRPGQIQLYLDDVLQDPSNLTFPDSTDNANTITVNFRPNFTAGEHTVYFVATDVNGNAGQTEKIAFQVGANLQIQYLGNHPNPFRRETVFVYILTNVAQKVSLKIYTVSGRLIRALENLDMLTPDYHEVVWDGKDEWGEEVANGVYFFRLKAEGETNQEITGKIAKLR